MASASSNVSVGIELKKATHPWFEDGFDAAYTLNGISFAQLSLVLDREYFFTVRTPGHPFYFTSSATGGSNAIDSLLREGKNGELVDNGTFEFLPARDLKPSLVAQIRSQEGASGVILGFYYQCGVHPSMGGVVRIYNPKDAPDSLETVEEVDARVRSAVLRRRLQAVVEPKERAAAAAAAVAASSIPDKSTVSSLSVKKVAAAEGLDGPTAITFFGGTMYVAEQKGLVYGVSSSSSRWVVLDVQRQVATLGLRGNGLEERGLLGLAFHPRGGRVFIYYSTRAFLPDDVEAGYDHYGCLSDFPLVLNRGDGRLVADMQKERVLLRVKEPYANHNGGNLVFGPDDTLYLGLGDGGSQGDPFNVSQNLGTMLGKILRIDVSGSDLVRGKRYRIPSDNPFVGSTSGALPEIYAYGFRNPWGMYYDTGGRGRLFAADVGYNKREEVNLVVKGGNHGWSYREGTLVFDAQRRLSSRNVQYVEPLIEYTHAKIGGRTPMAVVGGVLLDATTYVFGDFNGMVFVVVQRDGDAWTSAKSFLLTNTFIRAFARDPSDGAIYMASSPVMGLDAHGQASVVRLQFT